MNIKRGSLLDKFIEDSVLGWCEISLKCHEPICLMTCDLEYKWLHIKINCSRSRISELRELNKREIDKSYWGSRGKHIKNDNIKHHTRGGFPRPIG